MTLWAFLGLESACANSEAVENPEKNVPIAVMGGTIGAAVIYIISTNVIAGIVPNGELALSNAPFGLAFAQMFNPTIGSIVMACAIISCTGSLLGCSSPSPRCSSHLPMKVSSLKPSPR